MPDKNQEHNTTKLIGEYDGDNKEGSTRKESSSCEKGSMLHSEKGSSCKEGRLLHS